MKTKILTVALVAGLFAGNVMAQAQFSATPNNTDVSLATAAGTQVTVTMHYEDMGTGADSLGADLHWDPNQLTYVSHSGTGCAALPVAPPKTFLRHGAFDMGGMALPSGDKCTVVLEVAADNNGVAWADGDVATLTFQDEEIGVAGVDESADLLPSINATVTIVTGPPPDVIAGSDPVDGTAISIPGGAPGDTNSTSVDITIASGDEGTVSVTSCTVGAGFTIVAPGAFPANAPVTIEVEATLGAAALADTLNCVGTDSSAAGFDFSWPISAPEGTLLAGPTVSSNPSSANPLQLPTNTTGNPVSVPVTFTPNGGDVGGPDATVACAVSGAFTVTPANLTLAVGDAPASVAVGCSPGADVEAGSLTCTVNDETGANDIVWELVCPEMSVAPAAPTFVPASSLWSKLALFGMLGALGMLVLGLRRNH